MKILHLEASPGWGGQEIRILRESEGLRARGHEIFFGVEQGGGLVGPARASRFFVKELRFAKRHWLFLLFELLSLMEGVDVVVTHSSLDSWIGGLAARVKGIPIVRLRHLSTPIRPGWNARLLYGKLADAVVTTCQAIVPTIVLQAARPANTVRSVPTGVDLETILASEEKKQAFRRQWGIQPTDFLVGTACFMRSWKGLEDFLQAARLLKGRESIRWIIIGGGHEQTYRNRAQELEVDVLFTGHLENPYPAIGALDAFALLSTAHEGVSQAILQASALQKPLIATPTGGLQEVCLDQETGLQVPIHSPTDVAEAVVMLHARPDWAKEMGKRGRARVEQRFTIKTMLDQMEEIYTKVKYEKSLRNKLA